jgi:hypothetical protein
MKTTWLIGLLSLLLMAVYGKVAGGPSEAAQSPNQPATMAAPAAMEGSGELPAKLSEYVFLHQTRDENIPVHVMAGVKACEK